MGEAYGKATCPWCNERSEVVWDSDPSIGWQWKELTFSCPRCDEYVVLNEIGRTALDFVETADEVAAARNAVIEAAKALVEAQTKAADEASVAVAEWRLKENVDALEAAEKEGE